MHLVGALERTEEPAIPVAFVKLFEMPLEQLAGSLGFAEFNLGHFALIDPFLIDEQYPMLKMLDYSTGKNRVFFPVAADTFLAGPAMLTPLPAELQLVIKRGTNGTATGLQLTDMATGATEAGQLLPPLARQLDVEVLNEEILLAGTLTLPPSGDGPFPVVINVPGAGDQARGNLFNDYFETLPYYGIAIFEYDKRGAGSSTGNHRTSNFYDQADDVLAVAAKLAEHPAVAANNISLIAHGQAAYPAAIAATNQRIKNMVLLSAPVTSLAEQEKQATQLRMRADKFTETDIEAATKYLNLFFGYLRGETTINDWVLAARLVKHQPWAGYVTLPEQTDYVNWWQRYHDFTPQPYWEKLNVPVLAFYGSNDRLVPFTRHAPLLQQYVRNSGLKSSQVQVLEGVNHLLYLGGDRGDVQLTEVRGYAPKLFTTIAQWLLEQNGMR